MVLQTYKHTVYIPENTFVDGHIVFYWQCAEAHNFTREAIP